MTSTTHTDVISWAGAPATLPELRQRFSGMASVPAALYSLTPRAQSISEALVPLRLLAFLARDDVTAFATGPAGGSMPTNHVLPAWDMATGLHAAVAVLEPAADTPAPVVDGIAQG